MDRWGQRSGSARLVNGSYREITQCFDLVFDGHGAESLLVASTAPWTSPPSAAWGPSAGERHEFERFVLDLERVVRGDEHQSKTFEPLDRAVFFDLKAAVDATPVHHAVLGGSAFMIAVGTASGFRLAYLDNELTNSPVTATATLRYAPVAIFDMDGDGLPEVVYREDGLETWSEIVLLYDVDARTFRRVARSVADASP